MKKKSETKVRKKSVKKGGEIRENSKEPSTNISTYENSCAGPSTSSSVSPLTTVSSKRGGLILLRFGYRYRINKTHLTSSIWKCTNKECDATITIKNDMSTILRERSHQCSPDFKRNEFEIVFDNIKKEVQKNMRPISSIYKESIKALKSDDFVDYIPEFKSRQSILYRCRSKALKSRSKL